MHRRGRLRRGDRIAWSPIGFPSPAVPWYPNPRRLLPARGHAMPLFAIALYHHDPTTGRLIYHAMPVMLLVLVCLALAYRYYSAFLAARVAALDDSRVTPAYRLNDGQNYHPTNK